jgi:hypothetical protein
MHFVRITRDEAKEMVASSSRCLARSSFRRTLIFFLFSLLLLRSFALSAEPREGGGGGFLETFSTPSTNDDCDATTDFREDVGVKGWLSKSTRRLPREKSF